MKFEKDLGYVKFGKVTGVVIGYFIFTTCLYLVLSFTNKLPQNITYLHIALIVMITKFKDYWATQEQELCKDKKTNFKN